MKKLEEIRERSFEESSGNYLVKAIQILVLFVHNVKDKEVPFSDSERFPKLIPGAQLMKTEGLGRRKILKDDETAANIVNWILS